MADLIADAIRATTSDPRTDLNKLLPVALLVGHAPGAPEVVYELTDQTTSTPESVSAIESRFPAAALAQLDFNGD
jgi:phosphohistidine phosphatase SixA